MANREALRELQTRLAGRLQVARTDEAGAAQWLAVECGPLALLLPLAEAGEIFPAGTLQPLPHTEPWFAGVANLRGALHGVVDIAAFLGTGVSAWREHGQLVALNAALGSQSALLVQRLAGLRRADQFLAVAEEAPAAPRPAFAGPRWRDAEGRVWQEIHLAALARNEHYLAIARRAH